MTDDDGLETVQDDEGEASGDRETISRPSPRLHQEVGIFLNSACCSYACYLQRPHCLQPCGVWMMEEYAKEQGFALHPMAEANDSVFSFLRDRWKTQVDACIEAYWDDKSQNVDTYVAETMNFNAQAMRYDGKDIILVHAGIIFGLQNLFSILASYTEIFPERKEDGWVPEEWPVSLGHISHLQYAVCRPPFPIKKMGVKREQLVGDLTITAIDFMFNHELAHIAHGHTSWVAAKTGLELISEDARLSKGVTAFERLVLETDADAFAFQTMFRRSFSNGLTDDQIRHNFRVLILSTYAFFRMTDERVVQSLKDFEDLTHPPAAFRQMGFMGLGMQLAEMHPDARGIYESILVPTLIEAEQAFIRLGLPDRNPYRGSGAELMTEFIRIQQKGWAEIRPQLVKVKRGGNLAPIAIDT